LDHLSAALALGLGPRTDRSSPTQPRANWHVTLAFYGEAPGAVWPELASALAFQLQDARPFALELRGAGVFRRRVGWIGVGGDTAALGSAVRAAQDAGDSVLAGAAPGRVEQARPHLTVTRAADRPAIAAALTALSVYVGPSWTVDSVSLMRSELGAGPGRHALYTELARLPLGSGAGTARPAMRPGGV
jgi:2'-5' RNA ligase